MRRDSLVDQQVSGSSIAAPSTLDADTDIDTEAPRGFARIRAGLRPYGPPLSILLAVLVFWQVGAGVAELPAFFVPKPTDIVGAITENWAVLVSAIYHTAIAAVLGLLLAFFLGVTAAVVFSFSRFLERGVFPFTIVFQTTPVVAIAPIIMIWVGAGLRATILVAFIISFFPMVANTFVGLSSADIEQRSLFQLYGASKWKMMRKLLLPGAMPYILAGLRISAGLAVIGAIVGEFVAGVGGGQGGLGYQIQLAAVRLKTDLLFAGALFGSLLGLVFFAVVSVLSKRLLSWHESTIER